MKPAPNVQQTEKNRGALQRDSVPEAIKDVCLNMFALLCSLAATAVPLTEVGTEKPKVCAAQV